MSFGLSQPVEWSNLLLRESVLREATTLAIWPQLGGLGIVGWWRRHAATSLIDRDALFLAPPPVLSLPPMRHLLHLPLVGEKVADFGREGITRDLSLYRVLTFGRIAGRTVEEELAEWSEPPYEDEAIRIPEALQRDLVRLCCTLCLLEDNPELITPDVLAADRAVYERTGDGKYVNKAKRRGKLGWNVGAGIEVIPHVRRPHPALVWTGKGRAVPKVVMRKGAIVHQRKVVEVPHGRDEDQGH